MSALEPEGLAETLATEGRDELIVRFREAYAKAAGTHGDLVSFAPDQLEAMVQRSVADADGLQWRRALAGVAARELDIDLNTALVHPAVIRAHELVGAPSYESALGSLALPVPAVEPVAIVEPVTAVEPVEPVAMVEPEPVLEELPVPVQEPPPVVDEPSVPIAEPERVVEVPTTEPAPEADLESEAELESEPELEPDAGVEPEPELGPVPGSAADVEVATVDQPTMAYDIAAGEFADEADELGAVELEADPEELEFADGEPLEETPAPAPAPAASEPVADEFTYEDDAVEGDLRGYDFMADGDDAVEFEAIHVGGVAMLPASEEIALRISEDGLDLMRVDGEIVGRLGWTDISSMEITVPHGRRRRRGAPRLVVHTPGGSARFEAVALTAEDLQRQVGPLLDAYGR